MAKSPKGVWLVGLCLLLASCSQPSQTVEPPQATHGLLDLRGWSFSKNGKLSLSGEWAFYWQELLSPSQIKTNPNFIYVHVPDNWTNYKVNGQPLPPEGFATYRLIIHLPDPSQIYGLSLDWEGTAYSLWVDGKLIAQNGQVGSSAQDMIPQNKPQTVFFQPNGDTTEFVMQVSNWYHRKAGFRSGILIGLSNQIREYRRNYWAQDAFVMGIYLVMTLYHVFIFFFRSSDKGPLYFAIWSFINLVRAGFLNQRLFAFLFPGMGYEIALKIEYLTFYSSAPIYALFLQTLYPKDIDRWFLRIVYGMGAVFSVFMLFANTLTLSYTATPYQMILLIEMAYFVFFIKRILVNKREGAVYIAVGSAIAFAGVIGEILYLDNAIAIKVSSVYTFLAFILIQAILLSSRLSNSFQRVEILSEDLKEANINLLVSEKKYRSIFEESKDMIFIAGLDEQIRDANPSSQQILGYTQDELRKMKMSDFVVHYQDKERIENILDGQATVKDYELELRRKDGNIIHGLVTLTMRRDESGKPIELQGNVHDISFRKQAESERLRAMEFEQLAITDPLTQVYNRRVFDEIATKEWERARRSKSILSIILLDIDHFKQVNDTYGHLIGDQVLINLANLCLSNMRSMDIFARYGGEEFVILMPDADQDSARQSMERLRTIVETTPLATYENSDIFVTISAGIATGEGQVSINFNNLLDRADQALYESKETGRNRVTIWRES